MYDSARTLGGHADASNLALTGASRLDNVKLTLMNSLVDLLEIWELGLVAKGLHLCVGRSWWATYGLTVRHLDPKLRCEEGYRKSGCR